MLGIEILTLVPNHLSTVKKYQSTPSILHPYSLLFTTFHPSDHSTEQKPHQKWRGREKESDGEREKGEKECGTAREMEKKRLKRGKVDGYRHQSLIIYRPSLSPPMPNHLSTPHSRHQSLIICLPNNFTNFTTRLLVSMTVREGWKRGGWKWVEKRKKEVHVGVNP